MGYEKLSEGLRNTFITLNIKQENIILTPPWWDQRGSATFLSRSTLESEIHLIVR